MSDCKYCHEDKDGYILGLDKNGHVWINKPNLRNELVVRYYGNRMAIPIQYCPICGRKLKGEDNE